MTDQCQFCVFCPKQLDKCEYGKTWLAYAYDDDSGWFLEAWPDWDQPTVTHWMPLPEPPKEESNEQDMQ